MESKRFTPQRGKEYTQLGGGVYRCLSSGWIHGTNNAVMQNVNDKWTFIALGCVIHQDGTVEWMRTFGGRYDHSGTAVTQIQAETYTRHMRGRNENGRVKILQAASADPDVDVVTLQQLRRIALETA